MDKYSSNRALNKAIRKTESSFAINLAKPRWSRRSLESNLEWFVTWKIKQITKPEPFWCDGAKDLDIECLSSKEFSIRASVYIGPESDVNCINEAKLEGTLTLSSHKKRLKSYSLRIKQGSSTYELSKKT